MQMRPIRVYSAGMDAKSSLVWNAVTPTAAPRDARSRGSAQNELTSDLRRIDSADVFGTASEVLIRHGNVDYRLRRTSLGKLILTK